MLRNVIRKRWIVYILYCCLIFGIEQMAIKMGIKAFTWIQMSISFLLMFIFPIFITILIIRGKIVKKICIGILNSILSVVSWLFVISLNVSFFYSWIMFNIIFIEIIYQIDNRKWLSK